MSQLSPSLRFRENFANQSAFRSADSPVTVAISGPAQKGPVGIPTPVRSVEDYRKKFGNLVDESGMGFWVQHMFGQARGRGEIYVNRVAHYTDIANAATLTAATALLELLNGAPGFSYSGSSPATATSATVKTLQIALSGEAAQSITIADDLVTGASIAAAIQVAVRALTAASGPNQPDYNGFVALYDEFGRYLLVNGTAGATKTVVVTDGSSNDMATALKLGVDNGGTEGAGEAKALKILAKSPGTWGNEITVSVAQVNKVSTTLKSPLANGATTLIPTSTAGMVAGQYLEITDGTEPLTSPNPFYAEVERVEAGTVYLRAPLALTQTVEAGSTIKSLEFTLRVFHNGALEETWANLSLNVRNLSDYVVDRVNPFSDWIAVDDLDSPTTIKYDRLKTASAAALAGGTNGLAGLSDTDFVGDVAAKTGIQAFRNVETIDIMVLPDRPTAAVQQAMIALAEELGAQSGYGFDVVLDPPPGLNETAIVQYVTETALLTSDYASFNWPNMIVSDPRDRAVSRIMPPSAHAVGERLRSANQDEGVWNSFGGMEHPAFGVIGVEFESVYLESVRDMVYPRRINPFTSFRGAPSHFLLGIQLLTPGGTGGLRHVPQRALTNMMKKDIYSIVRSLLISRDADEFLLSELQATITSYMMSLLSRRAFRADTPEDAFVVDFVSPDVNPPEALRRGEVRGRVGPSYKNPFEFGNIELFEFLPERTEAPV